MRTLANKGKNNDCQHNHSADRKNPEEQVVIPDRLLAGFTLSRPAALSKASGDNRFVIFLHTLYIGLAVQNPMAEVFDFKEILLAGA